MSKNKFALDFSTKALGHMRKHCKTILREFKSTNQKDKARKTVPGNSRNRITAFRNIFRTEHSEKTIFQKKCVREVSKPSIIYVY